MTKKDTYQLLAVLQAFYPDSFRGLTDAATQMKVSLWQEAFADEPGDVIIAAAKAYVWKARRVMTALDMRSSSCGVELEDLMQSGYIAMVEAVHYYNPENGVAFSTCLINRLKTVFAEVTGYRTKSGQNEPLNNSLSLEKTVDDESDGTPFGEFISDPKAAAAMLGIEEKLWRKQLREALETALAALPKQSAEVLRLRHYQGLTLAAVGEIRGTTAERIRQMENKAIRQLRKPNIACHLRPFYDFDFYSGTGLGAFRYGGMSVQERYLVIEEKRKERESHRRQKERENKISNAVSAMIESVEAEAESRVANMTPEEKERLLKQYGFA